MSLENLREYNRRCWEDPELKATANEIGGSDIEGHIRHASSLGLEWTKADLFAARKEAVDAEENVADLSDKDLDRVVGGTGGPISWWINPDWFEDDD